MQLEIKTFQSAIASVLPFVPSRPSHPVLANVLVEPHFGDQAVKLTGFDLSMGVTLSIPAAVEIGEDAFTLPIKLLSDIVSKLSNGILTLKVAENVATIKANSGSYTIRGMAPEEYPALSVVESGETIEIPIADLLASLQPTMHSVSHEETKQVLTGVHFLAEHGLLELAATDGHRLTVSSFESDLDFKATVPGKFLNVLIKMIKASDAEMITIKIDAGMIEVEWASARLVSRLLEGQYPNYSNPHHATMPTH